MSNNNFYLVVAKNGRYVKTTTDNFWESCESVKEAAYYTKEEADKVIKHLNDKCYVYGAKAELICGPAEKKSRKGIGGIPKGCTWVIVDGKRKLVRPGEQAPISPISPNDNTGNFDNLQGTAKDCEQLRTTANNCGELTWQDIKLIVRRADYVLEKHTKKEILEMGEEQYYKNILHDFNILKKYCSVGSQQTPLLDELFRQIEDAVKKQAK